MQAWQAGHAPLFCRKRRRERLVGKESHQDTAFHFPGVSGAIGAGVAPGMLGKGMLGGFGGGIVAPALPGSSPVRGGAAELAAPCAGAEDAGLAW